MKRCGEGCCCEVVLGEDIPESGNMMDDLHAASKLVKEATGWKETIVQPMTMADGRTALVFKEVTTGPCMVPLKVTMPGGETYDEREGPVRALAGGGWG